MPQFDLDGRWNLSSPSSNILNITHPSAPYTVVLNGTAEYVMIREKLSVDGLHSGEVFPVVRNNSGVWEIFVTDNNRPCNDYSPALVEGARKASNNPNPRQSTDGLPIILIGEGYSNSARIQGLLLTGVCLVQNGVQIPIGPSAKSPRWISFTVFSETSKDMMCKSVLFDFLMQIVNVFGQK